MFARSTLALLAAGLIVFQVRIAVADQPDAEEEPELEVDDILADESPAEDGQGGEADDGQGGAAEDAAADPDAAQPAEGGEETAEPEAAEPDQPTPAEKSGPPPKRIAVKVFAAEMVPEVTRVALERTIADGASQVGSSEMVTKAPADKSDAEIDAALEKADADRDKGLKLMDDLEFEAANGALQAAADEYSRYLSELMLRDGNPSRLVDVYIKQVIVNYLNGDEEAASRELSRAFILDPSIQFDKKRFPPQLEEFVVQERLLFDELGKGTLSITVDGGLAMVLVNGMERGPAPVTVKDLPAGPNLVSLRVFGALPIAATGDVKGEATTELKIPLGLPRSRDSGPLAKARREVGKSEAGKRLDKAGRELGVDGLLLVVPTVEGGKIGLVAYVYDLRSGTLVNKVDTTVEPGSGEAEATALGGAALRGAVWPARQVELVAHKRRPIWKHKYFWPVVGAAAGVIVIGVIISASQGLSPGQKVGLFPTIRF